MFVGLSTNDQAKKASPADLLIRAKYLKRNMLDQTVKQLNQCSGSEKNVLLNGAYDARDDLRRIPRPAIVSFFRDPDNIVHMDSSTCHIDVRLHRVSAKKTNDLMEQLNCTEEFKLIISCIEKVSSHLTNEIAVTSDPSLRGEPEQLSWSERPTFTALSLTYIQEAKDRVKSLVLDICSSLSEYEEGCVLTLTSFPAMANICDTAALSFLNWKSVRHLYALECSAQNEIELPNISLPVVLAMQTAYLSSRVDITTFLPFDRNSSSQHRILPWATPKARKPYVRASHSEVRTVIIARVPWMETVWLLHPRVWLTGGLLMESISPIPMSSLQTNDVDLFTDDLDSLKQLAEDVRRSMNTYAKSLNLDEATVEQRGERRFIIKLLQKDTNSTSEHIAAFSCDVFLNSLARVARYHLPCVRCAMNYDSLFVTPSCAVSFATRVCVDYHFFSSFQKTPFEIIEKKWKAGFNFVVNQREQRQLVYFLQQRKSLQQLVPPLDKLSVYSLNVTSFEDFIKHHNSRRLFSS